MLHNEIFTRSNLTDIFKLLHYDSYVVLEIKGQHFICT